MAFKGHGFFKNLKLGYRSKLHMFRADLSFCDRTYSDHFKFATLNKRIHFRNVSIKCFLIDNFFNMVNPVSFWHLLRPLML